MKIPTFKSFMDYAIWSVEHNARAFAEQRRRAVDAEELKVLRDMQPPQKFCDDCKWVLKGKDIAGEEKGSTYWLCKNPHLTQKFDPVSGKPYGLYCTSVRLGDECGPAGKLWEPSIDKE